jgi:hypothetical protein
MNRTRGGLAVWLGQLQGSRSARQQGTNFAPREASPSSPPPTISTKAGKGIRTLDIQLGKHGSRAVHVRESALRCSDQG